jgi:hypothetical protein
MLRGPSWPEADMPRLVLGAVFAAVLLGAAVLVATLLTRPPPRPTAQVVVTGIVTGAGGQPVRGIKVWLNAWPTPAAVRSLEQDGQPVGVPCWARPSRRPAGLTPSGCGRWRRSHGTRLMGSSGSS